jgi:hypothetical protein
VRSFDGYPLTGIENMDGIKYIACVLDSMSIKQKPWDSIMKLNAKSLQQRIYDILERYLMKRSDIVDLYTKKREYVLLVPDEMDIPDEHNINKWTDFLPPTVEYSIVKGLTNISGEFKQDLLETIRKGHHDQHQYISVLKYKVKMFGLGIIETIHRTVKQKDLLRLTAAKVPFLENACCNEANKPVNPWDYFVDTDPLLLNYLQSSKSCIALLKDVKELSKAPILYHPNFTGIVYPSIPVGHLESTIYAAFIHYCKFDRPNPVPEELRSICGEKPADYNAWWSLEEKIEFLKRHGKRYSVEDLYHLMNIVEKRNIISIKESPEITEISSIHNEYRFDFNGPKIADVAYNDNGEIICIFEICHTHKTCSENRPEPWFEINALSMIQLVNNINIISLQIPCIRREKCDECIQKEKDIIEEIEKYNEKKKQEIEKYIEKKKQAIDILYHWFQSGIEIRPFLYDYENFACVEKNVKCEFIDEIFDVVIYINPNDKMQNSYSKFHEYPIQLISST